MTTTTIIHTTDEHCTVDAELEYCTGCGADHSGSCLVCEGRAFHRDGCVLSDADPS
jgi:hypothetical protein